MTPEQYESALQEVMTAFGCTHAQAEMFAKYCALTEQQAIAEAALDRANQTARKDAQDLALGTRTRRR